MEIARHIKSLAPRTLVSDGTYGRNLSIKETFAIEALQSKYVDIFDGHYYTGKYAEVLRVYFFG